ncbi:MAG: CBS domain-containing protein [Polyangiaceae bacterium]|nr:CBS domain-containing protein [Polyangiaceae bacterium]
MSCAEVYRYMTPSPQTIQRDAVLADARASMQRYGVRHLPVLDGPDLVGILYERELAVAERIADPSKVVVGDVMSPDPFLALPSTPLAEVAAEMVRCRFGAAVIVDRGNVVGVFTAVDALRALAEGPPSQLPGVVPP